MTVNFSGLFKNEFNINTFKVFLGGLTVGLINLLTLPLLTRLFAPEIFGQLQFVLACVAVLSVFGTLQYELAIVIPDNLVESNHILILCFLILMFFITVIFIAIYIFDDAILNTFNVELSPLYLYSIPALAFAMVLFSICQSTLVANKDFRRYSLNNVIQSAILNIVAIAAGLLNPVFLSLFLGYFLSHIIGSIYAIFHHIRSIVSVIDVTLLKKLVFEYKRFPLITTISVFINTLAIHIPVFLFSIYYGAEILGIYMISVRLLDIPLNLLKGSVTQVYFQAASRAYSKGTNDLLEIYKNTLGNLAILVGTVAVTIILVYEFIPVFLGPGWTNVGHIVLILLIWKVFEFLHAPIGHTWSIIKADATAFKMRLVSIVLRFSSIYIFRDDFEKAIISFSIVSGLYYLFMNCLLYYRLKKEDKC